MTVEDSLRRYFKKWLDFKGRSSRIEFWVPILLCFGVDLILDLTIDVVSDINVSFISFDWVLILIFIVLFLSIANVSLVVRHLHDIEQTHA